MCSPCLPDKALLQSLKILHEYDTIAPLSSDVQPSNYFNSVDADALDSDFCSVLVVFPWSLAIKPVLKGYNFLKILTQTSCPWEKYFPPEPGIAFNIFRRTMSENKWIQFERDMKTSKFTFLKQFQIVHHVVHLNFDLVIVLKYTGHLFRRPSWHLFHFFHSLLV